MPTDTENPTEDDHREADQGDDPGGLRPDAEGRLSPLRAHPLLHRGALLARPPLGQRGTLLMLSAVLAFLMMPAAN